jgi:hypothetical protein
MCIKWHYNSINQINQVSKVNIANYMPILKESLLKVVNTGLNQINLAFGSCSYFK